MENEPKREKFFFWLVKNSQKWWLWASVIVATSVLTNTGIPLVIGIGIVMFGMLSLAAGINIALEAVLGDDYAQKLEWKTEEKEKKNDTAN